MIARRIATACACGIVLLLAACSSSSDATPTPTATPDAEAAYIDDTLALVALRVQDQRGLDGGDRPAITLLGDDDLASLIDELMADPDWRESLTRDQTLYTLLGLIEPTEDLAAITREVSIAGIAGLYRPEIDHLYIRMFGSFSALEESTASHEYQHYLQDRHYDLETMLADTNRDTSLALHALVEGEASYVQNQYVVAHFNTAQAFGMGFGGALAAVDAPTVPRVLARETQFVYLGGLTFVSDLLAGDLTADQLFDLPPTTTEQILHPDKYLDGELGIDVAPLLAEHPLPAGWNTTHTDVLGEFLLQIWLRESGAGSDASDAAAGWNGDAFQLLTTDSGGDALLARIEWDSNRDADQFWTTAVTALTDNYQPHDCSSCAHGVWDIPAGLLALAFDEADDRQWTLLAVAPTEAELVALLNSAR